MAKKVTNKTIKKASGITDIAVVFIFILICQMAGIIGSVFTISNIPTWYAGLNKPVFNPPGWLFGPVWITLYTLMGISAYLIYRNKNKIKSEYLAIFFIHLFFNAIWSPIFFGAHELFLSFVVIMIIWFLIVVMISKFWSLNKTASLLLTPYFFWVSFASLLNASIYILNS